MQRFGKRTNARDACRGKVYHTPPSLASTLEGAPARALNALARLSQAKTIGLCNRCKFLQIPPRTRAWYAGLTHLGMNAAALGLFALVFRDRYTSVDADLYGKSAISVVLGPLASGIRVQINGGSAPGCNGQSTPLTPIRSRMSGEP